MSDFLDELVADDEPRARPEPNVSGGFDCFECDMLVESAYHDRKKGTLTWWCEHGHESVLDKVTF